MQKKKTNKKSLPISKQTKISFILGSLFLSIFLLWQLNQTIQLAFFTPKVVPVKSINRNFSVPKEITIPAVNIKLLSEETFIKNGIWEISQKGASHLSTSARPGENSTIIFYAHNTNERFGPIRWLSKNAIVNVKTKDGKMHAYKTVKTQITSPKDMDILLKNNGETLILYTCTGFADLQRFVLIAKPQEK